MVALYCAMLWIALNRGACATLALTTYTTHRNSVQEPSVPTLEQQVQAIAKDLQDSFAAFLEKHKRDNSERDKALSELRAQVGDFARIREQVREMENERARLDLVGNRPVQAGISKGVSNELGSAIVRMLRGSLTHGEFANLASAGNDPSGGGLLQSEWDATIQRLLKPQTALRQVARVQSTNRNSFVVPTSKNNATSAWAGEQSTRSETNSPDFVFTDSPLLEQYALMKVTQKLLDLDDGRLLEEFMQAIADAHANTEGNAFTGGDGVVHPARPRGFLTYPTAATADASRAWQVFEHIATGASGAFASAPNGADVFITTIAKLAAQYRANASWLMNSLTLAAALKLKDSQGGFLIQLDLRDSVTLRLLGYPIVIDETMPDLASGSLSVAYGDFRRGYLITDGPGRFLQDPYTAKPFVWLYSYRRVGGDVTDFNAIKTIKFS